MNFFNFLKPKHWQSNKAALTIVFLIILLGIMGALLSYSATLSSYGKEYINLTNNLNINTFKTIKHASDSEEANVDSFPKLVDAEESFSNTLNILLNGDTVTGLPPSPVTNHAALTNVTQEWTAYQKNIKIILSAEKSIRITKKFSDAINDVMPDIVELSETLITSLINKKGQANLVFIASHQLLLAQRITTSINQAQQHSQNTNYALDMLITDTATFRNVLESMIKGNKATNVKRVRSKNLRAQVQTLLDQFETIEELVIRVQEKAPQLKKVHKSTNVLINNTDSLLSSIKKLADSYEANNNDFMIYDLAAYAMGLIALILFASLGSTINKATQDQLASEEKTNKKTLDTILQLQQEISSIATGDLTTKATVIPGITESIAVSINYTIDALRKLVTDINVMSVEVSDTAEETQATAIHLARASDQQAKQLTTVTNSIKGIAQAFANTSKQAKESANLATQSVKMAEQGGETVRNTIRGMQSITQDIQETSNRIKRLGESSQEIGDIVELINDIADQTNILALNAAIKASVSNDEGQSFTGVADEVQQLAERVTQATNKIESLVNSIQLDTNQAIVSMEQSSTNVLHGTKVAEAAGDSLLRIESVLAHLSEFISNVAVATQTLTETSNQVSETMNTIKKVTDQNLAGTKQTASLTGKLASLAKAQQHTVNSFKLPKT